jgi:hypothetical protein
MAGISLEWQVPAAPAILFRRMLSSGGKIIPLTPIPLPLGEGPGVRVTLTGGDIMRLFAACIIIIIAFGGCAAPPAMMTEEYQERPVIETSLFSSDQAIIGEDAIQRLLSGKIVLPEKSKIAAVKLPTAKERERARYHYGSFYFESEQYQKSQQMFFETLQLSLIGTRRVSEVTILPSLMIPENPSISVLREAAVRVQADLLLIYRTYSNVYEKYVFLGRDKVKAYCSVEAVLLDVRTGIIPFTNIVTEVFEDRKEDEDITNEEMLLRAENMATQKSLESIGAELGKFLSAVP